MLLPKILLKDVQLGVERLAQQVYGFVEQRTHWVWVGKQCALHFDGIGFGLQRRVGPQCLGMAQQCI